MDALELLVKATVVVFVVSSMIAIGLAAQIAEIIAPLRRPVWVLRALVANFVLAPVVAVSIAEVLPLDPEYELGLLILAFAAGSPLLPKLAETGGADVSSATALMVFLMAGSVLVIPLVLPLFMADVQIRPGQIAAPLVVLMLLPLLLAIAVHKYAPRAAARFLPPFVRISSIGFVAVVLLICGVHLHALVGVIGSGAIGAALLFVVALLGGGSALGQPGFAGRCLFGYATCSRNIGAALVAAGASTTNPKTPVMLIVTGVVGLIITLGAAAWIRHRNG